MPTFEPLAESLRCDVCVVGAGITGLTCAYLLCKEGKSVIVLDDGPLSSGETQRTTAHITNVIDDRFFEIERMHGLKKAQLALESQTAAIEQIDSIVRLESIDCDFLRLDGYLFLGERHAKSLLERELSSARRLGFQGAEMVEELPLSSSIKSPAIRFPDQAQFHVLKYLRGIVNACLRDGCRLFTETHVTGIEGDAPLYVHTQQGFFVDAESVIIATNSPITDWVKVHTKQAAYRTYVIACRIPRGSVPIALYWDTDDPYHYVRLQDMPGDPVSQMMIVGGEDHKTGQKDDGENRFEKLQQFAKTFLPSAGDAEYRWSGQVYEPVDALGFIGKDPGHKGNVYIATGDSGMGMTHGTMSGIILRDLILGRDNPWADLYNPSRKVLSASVEYLKENVNAMTQYAAFFTPPETESVSNLKAGEGRVITRDGEKIAACRDLNGTLHEHSAYCPHLRGIVAWNSLEQSWDCPVHGSRFTADGRVIDGPANEDLRPAKHRLEEEEEEEKRNQQRHKRAS
ncbi:MAG TPA: FAD-dependent oxidoreductase [Candidatus Obscuribacterales bacterium]